ncbi:LysR family transcriptional regulator [Brucella anthropi]|uniref:LysR family transcriptional regulator n=1 Tax=Brucella anthropi TaxID=529 RepID=UPI00124D74AC|nr:LysR family transcriptional regulator [Brucella anthropi]KAB2726449.1 LysR family transcriptional regulator [Brucella anthropi]KAB2743611.1 LysR family transcriptional regulator [Brucella anthropi]KAB2804358.1 LysR family transcriptional regulator [Brucella anthropi]
MGRTINLLHDVDMRLIRTFMTVVRCGGFAAAQAALNVSQSNISMQIKDLEVRLGVRLCHRGRRGFWLTEEGKDIYAASEQLTAAIGEFRARTDAVRGGLTGRIHISVIDNSIFCEDFRLKETVASYRDNTRAMEIEIDVLTPNAVEQSILDGSRDIGIGFFIARRQMLDYHPLFESDIHLYCGTAHPLFDQVENAAEEKVTAAIHAARGYVTQAQLPVFERRLEVGATSASVEGLATLILSGVYTAYLPEHYARFWVQSGQMRAIRPDLFSYRSSYEAITLKGMARTRAKTEFLARLLQQHQK